MAGDGDSKGFSRRDFLRGSALAGAVGSGLFVPQEAEAAKAAEGVQVFGPGPVPMRLRVNGKPHGVTLEPRATLLDALRGPLDLTGAKEVCDRGTCGACTVLVDGKPVYACSVLAIAVQDSVIQTVESLGRPGRLHPLQAAFVDHDAQQCGFCTPGFVMAAKALLDRNPNPRVADVHEGLSGNFCRCGTYAGLRKAVMVAAKEMAEAEEEDTKDTSDTKDEKAPVPAPKAKPRKKKKRGGRPRG